MPPPTDTGSIGSDVLKALAGTDAVACAAGAGQIPGRGTALEQAAIMRDSGTTLDSVVEGLHAMGLSDGKPQVGVTSRDTLSAPCPDTSILGGAGRRGVSCSFCLWVCPPLASGRAIDNILSIFGFAFLRSVFPYIYLLRLFVSPTGCQNLSSGGGHILVSMLHFPSSL